MAQLKAGQLCSAADNVLPVLQQQLQNWLEQDTTSEFHQELWRMPVALLPTMFLGLTKDFVKLAYPLLIAAITSSRYVLVSVFLLAWRVAYLLGTDPSNCRPSDVVCVLAVVWWNPAQQCSLYIQHTPCSHAPAIHWKSESATADT